MAVLASIGIVLAAVAVLATMTVVGTHNAPPRLTVVPLRELDTKPVAPPPAKHLEKTLEKQQPTFVPQPKIALPAQVPVEVALNVPPPPVQAPPLPVPDAAPGAETGASAAGSAVEGGDLSGTVLSAKPPIYPEEARRRHQQGTVKLLVLVGPDGRVSDINVAASSGSSILDHAALRAVRRWCWTPNKRGGVAVAVRGYVTIPFILAA